MMIPGIPGEGEAMNKILNKGLGVAAILCCLQIPGGCSAPEQRSSYEPLARTILARGLTEQGAYRVLEQITSVGPRLAGSPQAAAAVDLAAGIMRDLGFDDVHLEPAQVEHWLRGEPEQARLVSTKAGTIPLDVCALGGSIGTPADGVSAEILEVKSFDELRRAGEKARGRVIFFNRAWDQSKLETFAGYGPMVQQRDLCAIEAARAGGVAAVARSATTSLDDYPHTGLMHYDPALPPVPAAALSTKSADRLSETLAEDPSTRLYLWMNCRGEAPVTSYNVVGEIRGGELPSEIILLGGHLDSWDLGAGAHDDGAGCSQAVEALRLIRAMGLKPKRTIRAVLFMDEEFGGAGGRDYARSDRRKSEKHLVAIESDRGGFRPLGIGIGNQSTFPKFQKWEPLLQAVGLFWLRPGGGGVDIAPLAAQGTVMGGLVPDSQRYFDFHHSARDVLSAVNPRELEIGAVAMAVLAYVLAKEGI
jgi:carboxypeptidase Q